MGVLSRLGRWIAVFPPDKPMNSRWFVFHLLLWVVLLFGTARFAFGTPDYSHVPKYVLFLTGYMCFFAAGIHLSLLVRLVWSWRSGYANFRAMGAQDLYARLLTASAIVLLVLYTHDLGPNLASLLPLISHRTSQALRFVSNFAVSVVASLVANMVYARITKRLRKEYNQQGW
jgi:hypothetical protein